MSIKVGTATPSRTQLQYLEKAHASNIFTDILINLSHVVRDEELESGEEELHPDWLPLYRSI